MSEISLENIAWFFALAGFVLTIGAFNLKCLEKERFFWTGALTIFCSVNVLILMFSNSFYPVSLVLPENIIISHTVPNRTLIYLKQTKTVEELQNCKAEVVQLLSNFTVGSFNSYHICKDGLNLSSIKDGRYSKSIEDVLKLYTEKP